MDVFSIAATCAAVAASVATLYYAKLTRSMVMEMKYGNDMLSRPNMNVLLEPSKKHPQILELCLVNSGNACAYNVRLTNLNSNGFPGLYHKKEELTLFKTQIPVFSEKLEIRTLFLDFPEFFGSKSEKTFLEFEVTYTFQTRNGEAIKVDRFKYDLLVWENTTCHAEGSVADMVEQQKEIKNSLKKINNTLEDLKTDSTKALFTAASFCNFLTPTQTVYDFISTWDDFNALDSKAFNGALYFRLKILSFQVCSVLGRDINRANKFSRLRKNLIRLTQKHFYLDGGQSYREFLELGDDIVENLRKAKLLFLG
jgi:hypothetical protein